MTFLYIDDSGEQSFPIYFKNAVECVIIELLLKLIKNKEMNFMEMHDNTETVQ